MKNIIIKSTSLFCCFILLAGCGSYHALKRESSTDMDKIVKVDSGLYLNANTGHKDTVKQKINETSGIVEIIIPIELNRDKVNIPTNLPRETAKNIKPYISNDKELKLQCSSTAKDVSCTTTQSHLKLSLKYSEKPSVLECIGGSILGTALLPVVLIAGAGNPYKTVCSIQPYFSGNVGLTVSTLQEDINRQDLGVKIERIVYPTNISLSCDKKSCSILDKENNIVNKITINEKIIFDNSRLETLLKEEKIKDNELARKNALIKGIENNIATVNFKNYKEEEIIAAFASISDGGESIKNLMNAQNGDMISFAFPNNGLVTILQVVGDKGFLLKIGNLVFYGNKMPNVVKRNYYDGQHVEIGGVVNGTYTYTTITGAPARIPKVDIYAITPYRWNF